MKQIVILFLSFIFSISASAQTEEMEHEESTTTVSPRMLAIDTMLSYAEVFSAAVINNVPGYRLAFADRETPGILKHVFKTEGDATLRLEYQYTRQKQGAREVPVIVMQRIRGDADAVSAIYNYLFESGIAPDQLSAVAGLGSEISHHGKMYKLILEPDDYAPGNWMMTIIR